MRYINLRLTYLLTYTHAEGAGHPDKLTVRGWRSYYAGDCFGGTWLKSPLSTEVASDHDRLQKDNCTRMLNKVQIFELRFNYSYSNAVNLIFVCKSCKMS